MSLVFRETISKRPKVVADAVTTIFLPFYRCMIIVCASAARNYRKKRTHKFEIQYCIRVVRAYWPICISEHVEHICIARLAPQPSDAPTLDIRGGCDCGCV